jgi:voltage-gated potassium channel
MGFAYRASAAVLLVVLTLCLQCGGLAVLITWLRRAVASGIHKLSPFHSAALVMRSMAAVILLHASQVLLWASAYHWFCLPSWESAFYFSASSYATVGYGDLVLPSSWRMLGPLESIIGVLMCGVTVSLLFAIVTRLIAEAPSRGK